MDSPCSNYFILTSKINGLTGLSSDETESAKKSAAAPQKKQTQVQEKSEDDSSSHESLPSSSSEITSESDSSTSEQSEDEKTQQSIRKRRAHVTATSGKERAGTSSGSSSSDDSTDSTSSSSSESGSSEDEHKSRGEVRQALEEKKRLDRQAAHAAALAWQPKASPLATASLKQKNGQRRASTGGSGGGQAFRRVEDNKWAGSLHDRVKSNHYEATFGAEGYGYKAHQKLSAKRGKEFRHEKTKRKRGSYRGGKISMEQNGFKFDSD